MTQTAEVAEWRSSTVVDGEGDKIGKLEEVYLDTDTGEPEWALVNTGLFGSKSTFIPLAGASADGDDVKAQVKDKVDERKDALRDSQAQAQAKLGEVSEQAKERRKPIAAGAGALVILLVLLALLRRSR